MQNASQAKAFALRWIETWNSHDLDAIMSFYARDISIESPVAAQLRGDPSGKVSGWDNVRAYYKRGLELYPHLSFQLIETMWGLSSVIIYYVNHKGTRTCDFFELDATGKIVRNLVHYSD